MSQHDDLTLALARLGTGGRNGDANIRPVLLRVVVDLFVQRDVHTLAELKSFEAMVTPLLAQADAPTRALVADKLFKHPDTPSGLRERLLDTELVAAVDLVRHAELDEEGLLGAAANGPAPVAMMIANRPALSAKVIAILAARPEPQVAFALAGNPDAALDKPMFDLFVARARRDRDLAERLARRAADPLDVAPLFALLGPGPRHAIVDAARRLEMGRRSWARTDSATAAVLKRLDHLVLGGEWEAFDHVLCATLGWDPTALRPLLHDGTGDILALALAAVGARSDLAARAFILGDPKIGHVFAEVRRLSTLVDTISPLAARRLIGAILGGRNRPKRMVAGSAPPALGRRFEAHVDAAAPRRGTLDQPLRRRG